MSPRFSPHIQLGLNSHGCAPRALAAAAFQACCLLSLPGVTFAQAAAPSGSAQATAENTLPAISVTAPAPRQARASISGLGDTPGWQTPVQAQTFGAAALRDAGVTRLADLSKLDASVSDAYNPVGYWDSISVRGYKLENAYNVRREGLPISAETRIALDNKAGIELFKGTSGIQAGTSAPAGLVNYLVKRPDGKLREVTVGLNDRGGWLLAADLSDRFGERSEYGLRVNMAREALRPTVAAADGRRRLAAVAGDWQLSRDTRLEAEFEHSFQSQPSVPGFSLLGTALPSAKSVDPTINLNNQAWSRPVALQGNTGSLRWTQTWQGGWRSQLSYGEQRLQSTDRGGFPFGCYAENNYAAYCGDGSFDFYDFRSPGEHRRTRAWNATLQGQVQTGALRHELTFGLLRSRHDSDLQQAAYNQVTGTGNISGQFTLPEAPTPLLYANTSRRERSTELSVVDAIGHSGPWRAWLGLRHTRLERDTRLTDGSGGASLDEHVSTGWAALGYQLAEQTQAYASWGQGIEASAVQQPSGKSYANAGDVLPVRRSRQLEVGLKSSAAGHLWGVNAFQIHRPVTDEVGSDGGSTLRLLNDGEAVHKGLEASWQWRNPTWQTGLSASAIDTERRGSQRTDVAVNGKPAVNVPEHAIKASVAWRVPGLPSTWLQTDVIHEGPRAITADNSVRLPSWTRTDLALRTATEVAGTQVTWRVNVHNLFNLRNWREAPTYSNHVYLMPQAPRSVSASAQISF
jgi:iron complex outermembrane receptor protein